ncbi:hypothetical protein GGI06_001952 [Coemansia sp. S85]|nr:hypothetical protein GGI06_001952 [Coemansia sp. S85]
MQRPAQLPKPLPPAGSVSYCGILELIIGYLSPVPPPNCRGSELLAHLRCLQRLAAVDRQWQAVASPMFYRTALVVIDFYSESSDGVKLRTNIDIFNGADQLSHARELHIIECGAGLTAERLHR